MIGIPQIVRELQQQVQQFVEARLLDLFSYTKISKVSKNGRDDKVEGREDDENADTDTQRVQHYGLRSIPPIGTWAVRVRVGSQSLTLGEDSTKHAPTDLEEGELQLFNSQSGVRVKLTKDGDVLIDAKSGRQIKLASSGGGEKEIARKDDPVALGTWQHVPASGIGVSPCQLSWVPFGGGATQTFASPTAIEGVVKQGSSKAKCG